MGRFRNGNKFSAVMTVVDGIKFRSKAEAKRYGELLLLAKAGQIRALVLQPKYPLHVKEWKIGAYVADFAYIDQAGRQVVEDVKGFKTTIYKWKKRHVEAEHGITITEIR